eukprot:scaffold164_cov266-Chaetoceros_neogracile.AAC.39
MFFISDLYEQNGETQTWAGNGNDVRNEEQHFSRWIWDLGSGWIEDRGWRRMHEKVTCLPT